MVCMVSLSIVFKCIHHQLAMYDSDGNGHTTGT
jgi:hypothetical protein